MTTNYQRARADNVLLTYAGDDQWSTSNGVLHTTSALEDMWGLTYLSYDESESEWQEALRGTWDEIDEDLPSDYIISPDTPVIEYHHRLGMFSLWPKGHFSIQYASTTLHTIRTLDVYPTPMQESLDVWNYAHAVKGGVIPAHTPYVRLDWYQSSISVNYRGHHKDINIALDTYDDFMYRTLEPTEN